MMVWLSLLPREGLCRHCSLAASSEMAACLHARRLFGDQSGPVASLVMSCSMSLHEQAAGCLGARASCMQRGAWTCTQVLAWHGALPSFLTTGWHECSKSDTGLQLAVPEALPPALHLSMVHMQGFSRALEPSLLTRWRVTGHDLAELCRGGPLNPRSQFGIRRSFCCCVAPSVPRQLAEALYEVSLGQSSFPAIGGLSWGLNDLGTPP